MNFQQSSAGKMVKMASGYSAFVPNPLPPKIDWDDQLIYSLSRADFLLGKLAQEGNKLPNPQLFIRPFITREAVFSSMIEGTVSTVGDILAFNAGVTPEKQSYNDLHEVQNYIRALDYGIKRLNDLPLSLRLIREIHAHLMEGARGDHATPGEFRRSQNWIGRPGSTLQTAKFVPPPVDYLMECLGDLESFLGDRQMPPLIHAGLCHYQFEAIHPFLDGNGRIGRLLIMLLLIEQKLLESPILYVSAFFEATRDEYYKQLLSVSRNGTWRDWLLYFLEGIALQSEDVLSRVERINKLLTLWKHQFIASGSSMPLKIIDQLAANPYLTIQKTAEDLEVAYNSIKRAVQKLEAADILKQTSTNERNKVYCATKLLAILEEPTKIRAY